LVLAGVALLAVPRMIWDVPRDQQWSRVAPGLLIGVAVVALAATAAAIVNVVDQIWHTSELSPSTEALNVAQGVAASVLFGLAAILSWFAAPFIRASVSPDQPISSPSTSDQPGCLNE
jgi:hypothetical protein